MSVCYGVTAEKLALMQKLVFLRNTRVKRLPCEIENFNAVTFNFLQLKWMNGNCTTQHQSPSGKCANLHAVAASNNRGHPTRSLSSLPSGNTINRLWSSQALLETTHQDHSIGVTLRALVVIFNRSHASIMRDYTPQSLVIGCSRHIYMGVILRAHPVRGEPHIQRNANREVATHDNFNQFLKIWAAVNDSK